MMIYHAFDFSPDFQVLDHEFYPINHPDDLFENCVRRPDLDSKVPQGLEMWEYVGVHGEPEFFAIDNLGE